MPSLNKVHPHRPSRRRPRGSLHPEPRSDRHRSGSRPTEISKDKSSGERKETTEWHRVIFFNRTAEVVGEYLRRAPRSTSKVRIHTRKWQDSAGQDRYCRRDHRQRNADARRSSIGEGRQSIGFRPSSCRHGLRLIRQAVQPSTKCRPWSSSEQVVTSFPHRAVILPGREPTVLHLRRFAHGTCHSRPRHAGRASLASVVSPLLAAQGLKGFVNRRPEATAASEPVKVTEHPLAAIRPTGLPAPDRDRHLIPPRAVRLRLK